MSGHHWTFPMLRVKHCPLMPQNDAPGAICFQLQLSLLTVVSSTSIFQLFSDKIFAVCRPLIFWKRNPPQLAVSLRWPLCMSFFLRFFSSGGHKWQNKQPWHTMLAPRSLVDHVSSKFRLKNSLPGHFDNHHFSRKRHRACNASRMELR